MSTKKQSGQALLVEKQASEIQQRHAIQKVQKRDRHSKEKEFKNHQAAERLKAIKKASMKVIWGNDIDDLNTVGCTIRYCSFFSMQMIRLFMLILLFGSWMIYSYVYMRSVLFFYNWWASTFTLMAFTLLFIGSGKQVVFQKLVELKMIEFGDPK